ncbi:MAG: HAMP domain-containing histidine kinase [Cyanobacteria bacterium LVE1205-1]|jgi:OmpR-family two-component system manganese-sensing sensor histidine kinase
MFQATRQRLAIWYTMITAVLFLLFATGVYIYVRSTLIERIDDTLSHVVEVVGRSLAFNSSINRRPPSANDVFQILQAQELIEPGEEDHIDLEWFNADGELGWFTFLEPLNVPLHINPNGETIRINPSFPIKSSEPDTALQLRQITKPITLHNKLLGYLRVSHPWFEVTKPTHQLMWDLSIGIAIMVGMVGTIGWFLSGLAMEPVLEAYQRLKQFTADASHELRNPVAMIQTNVQVALSEPEIKDELKQQLTVVERLTRRLGKLVEDLLFLTRQDSGMIHWMPVTVHLDEVLMEVVEEQQAIADEKGIHLLLDLPESDVAADANAWFKVQGDRDQLCRLFTNLIDNALHCTPSLGMVRVTLQSSVATSITRLQVRVTDTGVGIPETELPHIFDRFYPIHPVPSCSKGKGFGLGLAIVRAIVDNHHGQIEVESQLNKGTMFVVTLPTE